MNYMTIFVTFNNWTMALCYALILLGLLATCLKLLREGSWSMAFWTCPELMYHGTNNVLFANIILEKMIFIKSIITSEGSLDRLALTLLYIGSVWYSRVLWFHKKGRKNTNKIFREKGHDEEPKVTNHFIRSPNNITIIIHTSIANLTITKLYSTPCVFNPCETNTNRTKCTPKDDLLQYPNFQCDDSHSKDLTNIVFGI